MSLILPKNTLTRRRLLQLSGLSGIGLVLGGCSSSLFSNTVGQISEPLNQSLEALLLSQKPVPEFPKSAIEPQQLLINSFDFTQILTHCNFV